MAYLLLLDGEDGGSAPTLELIYGNLKEVAGRACSNLPNLKEIELGKEFTINTDGGDGLDIDVIIKEI